MSISIFAKQAFLNTDPHQPYQKENYHGRGHLMRVSSMIRGGQVADAIGAKYNPKEGYQEDVCIYVKPHLKKDNMTFNFEGRKAYIDIIDGHNLGQTALNYPEVGVIVCSRVDQDAMYDVIPNEIVLIPQHHCNFDRIRRTRKGIKTVGVIGTESSFSHLPEWLEEALNKIDVKLIKFSKFFERKDIIKFYKKIDVQLVWRPYKKILSNPLKIVNASSFGIPTIALAEPTFKEVSGCLVIVHNLRGIIDGINALKAETGMYEVISNTCFKVAEEYHIDNIAKMYKKLDQ